MKNVLVFGATSAVAQGFCEKLLQDEPEGCQFFFFARNPDKLIQAKQRFSEHIIGSHVFDLLNTNTLAFEEALASAYQCLGSVDLVLVAHGDLLDQLASEKNNLALTQSLMLNAVSPLSIVVQCLNLLQKHQQGAKFAVITSVAGQRGRPRNFTYGAAKGSVSLFLQGLRSVYYKSGWEFYDFRLGPVDTPMTVDHEKNFSFSSVEQVSKIMVGALKRKAYVVYVPGWWRTVMWAVRVMPEWLFQRLGFLSDR